MMRILGPLILSLATAVQPAATGTLTGRALFDGTPPAPAALSTSADPACVQLVGSTVRGQDFLVDGRGGLQSVFVYIKSGLDPAASFGTPAMPVTLDQVVCQFSPHVLGVRMGQPLEINNRDPLLHNVHGRPVQNQEFNIGQPIQGMRYTRTFDKPEVMVPLTSDIHPWMTAYVGVMTHPFFAVTGADGSFTIAGVPPGTYAVEAWHERLGAIALDVTVGAGQTVALAYQFTNR
jgi:hypothetical protein